MSNEIEEAKLGPRIKTACKEWNITTLEELRTAHEAGRTKQWRGIGNHAIAELDRFFRPAETPLEKGRRFYAMKLSGVRQSEIARREGITPAYVSQLIRLSKQEDGPDLRDAAPEISAALRHERKRERRNVPLHARLEFMALQLAADAENDYHPRKVQRAIHLFELADRVRNTRTDGIMGPCS